MKRIGSSGSRLGPAVTTIFSPARSLGLSSRRISSTMAGGFRKTALALVAAGQIAGGRLHDVVAGAPQLRQVRLHHGVGQHVHVHGRNHQQRRLCGQRHGGEKVIGNARGQFGDDVGRGRCDHQQVGGVREIDVPDFGFLSQAEQIGGYR